MVAINTPISISIPPIIKLGVTCSCNRGIAAAAAIKGARYWKKEAVKALVFLTPICKKR